ncbi:PAS domain-containing protein [Yoonia sp.]|uniref:PAS domain-containing protein n=1 Tax=Yoonia sp. TaxID=2212373 RepID=UPI003976FF94
MEEALRQSEDKYRTILENIQEGYYEVDIAGNYTFFNPPVCSIQRRSPERLMGMNYRRYTHGQDRDKLYRIFNRVFTTGQPARPFSQKIIRADGTTCYVEISAPKESGVTSSRTTSLTSPCRTPA